MSTSLVVGGPSQWYVGIQGTLASPTYVFLGWCESDSRVSPSGEFETVLGDYGGTRVGVDWQFMGEEAFISGDLVRTNEEVLAACTARVRGGTSGQGGVVAGSNYSLGGLMITQGLALSLCIVCPYASLGAFAAVSAPACYTFPAAWLEGSYDASLSTRRKIWRMNWHAVPVINPISNTSVLYTNVLPTLPGPS